MSVSDSDSNNVEMNAGAFDCVSLVDYKSTEFLPREPKPEHVAQLNLYNYLLKANGWPTADYLEVHYFSGKGEQPLEAPIWTDEQVLAYIQVKAQPVVESWLFSPFALGEVSVPLSLGEGKSDGDGEPTQVTQPAPALTNQAEADSWLPERLNPADRNNGGWKCNPQYCDHAAYCWPSGVPGLEQRARAKQAADGAVRRGFYAALKRT